MDKEVSKTLARTLRRNQTEAEKRLWRFLRSREFEGIKFRRQQPVGPYVADFCSFQAKVIVELDGGQHALTLEKDEKRTRYLTMSGYRVVRVWNDEVLVNTQEVLEKLRQTIIQIPLTPTLSRKGRGRKRNK